MTTIRTIAAAAVLATSLGGIAQAQGGPSGPGGETLDFEAIDSDANGSLSRAELQARAVARLGRADANGDGWLDREEIVVILPGHENAPFRIFSIDPEAARADRLLALLGATEAGRVEIGVVADHRVNMLLAAMDSDRDAAISQAEVDAHAAERERRHERHRHGERHGGPDRGPHAGPGPHGPGPQGDRPDAPRGPRPPADSPEAPMPAPGQP